MSPPPKVSICIPVYNGLPWIEHTMRSVMAQTLQDFEVIVRDDCSRDGTADFLQERFGSDHRVRIIRNDRNVDVGGQYNLLFEDARGEFILKLDADDLIAPAFLQRTISAASSNLADVVMAGWEWLQMPEGRTIRPQVQVTIPNGFVNDPLRVVLEKNPFHMCFGIFRRHLLDQIRRDGQFVLFTETCDWECQVRLAIAGAKFYFITDVLGHYRLHDSNRSYRPNAQGESIICDVLPYWHDVIRAKLGQGWLRANAIRLLSDHLKAVAGGRAAVSGKIVIAAARLITGRVLFPHWCLRSR